MNKRNREHMSLGDALKEFLGQGKLKRGMDQINVRDCWNKMMGYSVRIWHTLRTPEFFSTS